MDRSIYIAMTGANEAMEQQNLTANNLANVNTTGFQAQIANAESKNVAGNGWQTRTMAVEGDTGISGSIGSAIETGRMLDVMPSANGYLTVLDSSGKEAYTRDGNIQITASGELMIRGHAVLGTSGPIILPPDSSLQIGTDGSIETQQPGGAGVVELAKLKLVHAKAATLKRGSNGLIYTRSARTLPESSATSVQSGMLEGSNVNSVQQMVSMLNASRQYDLQVRVMQTASQLEKSGDTLLQPAS